MKVIFLVICMVAFTTSAFCQIYPIEQESEQERLKSELSSYEFEKKEVLYLKSIYLRNDTTLTAIKELHESTFIQLVDSLDRVSPEAFYQKSAELLSQFKIDQAVFLLNLGQLRFKYFNLTDPNYSASGGGALLMSLNYTLAEPINKYLKINIDNYIEILNSCIEWHSKHDYVFVTENKDSIKYNKLTNSLIAIRDNYIKNKDSLKKEGIKEAKEFLKNSDGILRDIEKGIKRIKKQLKQIE